MRHDVLCFGQIPIDGKFEFYDWPGREGVWVRSDDHRCAQEREFLRIGMSGGRSLIEQSRKPKSRKDNLTVDMFDQQQTLF